MTKTTKYCQRLGFPVTQEDRIYSDANKMLDALRLIAMESHNCKFSEPVNWEEIANTMVSIAKNALREIGQ